MVMFENVLSHTSTQKSPKYLNLHKLPAEFYLGFFFAVCQNELGLGAGWNELAKVWFWFVLLPYAIRQAASQRDLFHGMCFLVHVALISRWSRAVCWCRSAHPCFLNKPQIRQARAQWSSLLPRAAQAGTVCPLPLMCNCPFFVWPVAVRVDGPKPSGLHNFCSCLRPDLSWALWKI